MAFTSFPNIRLVNPGYELDSCISVGMFIWHAAFSVGPLA